VMLFTALIDALYLLGPSTNEQAKDATQKPEVAEKDSDHKELMSKLEVLEERVQKLETENQELKEQKSEPDKDEALNQEVKKAETERHDVDNHEEKVVDKPIAVESTKKTSLQGDAIKSNDKEVSPDLMSRDKTADSPVDKEKMAHEEKVADKDNLFDKDSPAVAVAHQPANSLPQANEQLKPIEQQQRHAHEASKEVGKDDKSIINPLNTDTENGQPKAVKEKANSDSPDLTLGKEQGHADSPDLTLEGKQNKVDLPDISLHKDTGNEDVHNAEKVPVLETHQDENDHHQRGADSPKIDSDVLDQKLEQLVDQKLKEELLKIKTENVGVRSRDLLHSDTHEKNDVETDNSQISNPEPDKSDASDKLGANAAHTALNKTMISDATNSLKRNMLSLKQSDNSETQLLNNGG